MGGLPRDGVAAIASNGKIGTDLAGPSGVLARTPVTTPFVFDEPRNLPAHAQCEARITGGLRGEEVQEIPLRHERDKLCVRGQMR